MSSMLSATRDTLIGHAEVVNCVVILMIILPAIYLWLLPSKNLSSWRHYRRVLEFWIAQWVVALIAFHLIRSNSDTLFEATSNWEILTTLDFQSILILALAAAIVEGDALKPTKFWLAAVVVTLGFLSYNVVVNQFPAPEAGSPWRYAWILPSAFTSTVAFVALGSAFLSRYGRIGLPALVVTFAYALFQWPIYISTVVRVAPDRRWYLLLAITKLFIGGLFFLYCLAPVHNRRRIPIINHEPQAESFILRSIRGLGGVVLALLVGIAATIIGSFFITYPDTSPSNVSESGRSTFGKGGIESTTEDRLR